MARTTFRQNEIIFLLGAGASVEAGIPDSNKMVQKIQEKISTGHKNWKSFTDLYRYIRSSVFYADGLEGIFGDDVPFNIERLVNALDELRKKERHTLYPFVGAWNPKLLAVAGKEFDQVHKFRDRIITTLRDEWVPLPQWESAKYYGGLLRFQNEYGYPLRLFSLNYDLCVEQSLGLQSVQRGFQERKWDWRLFDESSDDPLPIILYKLHGSLDWHFSEDGNVTYSDVTSNITNDEIALIFGTSYKLQYVDPFLFLAYELRRWTLDAARIIVCVGYGFNDDHINGILKQSLRQERQPKLLVVMEQAEENKVSAQSGRIEALLNANPKQIEVRPYGAKTFFQRELSIDLLSSFFPEETDLFAKS